MKTLINILFTSIISFSCNSQSLENEFKMSLSSSTALNSSSITKTVGKISVTYPNNLNSNFQNIINQHVANDFTKKVCDGQDASLEIVYELKYYSKNILSIYKIEYYDYCNTINSNRYSTVNLFHSNNSNYLVELNFDSETLKKSINSHILTINQQSKDCTYDYENSLKGFLIYNKFSMKTYIIMDKMCNQLVDLDIQTNGFIFKLK